MALVLADRVRETTTTTGTGTVSLAGPVSGFQGFSAAIGNANTTYYTIVDASTGAWEVGLGTYTSSGSTLARTTILSSSNAGAAVNFAAGTKDVFVTQPAERALYLNGAGTGIDAGAASFTANGVVYASSTSALATGSALTFDGSRLTVSTSVLAEFRIADTGSATDQKNWTWQYGTGVGAGLLRLRAGNDANTDGQNAYIIARTGINVDSHQWLASGTEKLRLTATSLYTASDVNVGIGTNSTSQRLTIDSADTERTSISLSNSSAGGGFFNIAAVGSAGWLGAPVGSLLIRDSNAGVSRIVLDSAGNVGIGTSSPFTRLESAAARATTLNSIASFNTMAASVTDTTAFAVGVGGGINFRAQLTASTYSTYASIWSFRESANTSDYKGSLIFGTSDNGDGYPEERMRLDSSGNLGLGVIPSDWSTVLGFQVRNASISDIGGTSNNSNFGSNWYYDATGNFRYISSANATNLKHFNGQFQFFTAPSGTAGDPITFTQAMTLDASGNLGVGETSPATYAALAVKDKGGNGTIAAISATNTLYIKNSGTSASITYNDAYPLIFGTNNTERARITSGGDFGIGTSTPAYKLDVEADASTGANNSATGAGTRFRNIYTRSRANSAGISGGLYAGQLFHVSGGAEFEIYNADNFALVFGTNATERARITSGGDLLVGTTSALETERVAVVAPLGSNGLSVSIPATTSYTALKLTRTGSDGAAIAFSRGGSDVGTVSITTTATAYNTSSDYRLKNITGPITTSGAYIDSLNPVEGTWKADGATFVGLIAHEVQEASRTPVATGVKDGEQMQGMDYSSAELIANMLAELKSLRQRLAAAGI
jgi:hypothetical protein